MLIEAINVPDSIPALPTATRLIRSLIQLNVDGWMGVGQYKPLGSIRSAEKWLKAWAKTGIS